MFTDAYLEFEQRRDEKCVNGSEQIAPVYKTDDLHTTESSELSVDGDKYKDPEPIPSTFSQCYSDSESDDESDQDRCVQLQY